MIRILGSSYEKVEIKDLGDTIFYHQQKDYTEQQYESSRDLQREIQRGRIVKLSQSSSVASANNGKTNTIYSGPSISLRDVKDALRDIIPSIVDAVRQEVKQASPQTVYVNQAEAKGITQKTKFVGPEYIPNVSTEGMISSITPEEKKVSGDDMQSALEALRNMGSK